ncbi:[Pyruvate dehydrogenase (acetyl-transferring)] kinase isozyme 4 [Entomortierella lignicola]|nr:[Pyruvate dehydrogenase (acetyl-transferring)] kinase isozyme 4 [Entomortierella lignicola]
MVLASLSLRQSIGIIRHAANHQQYLTRRLICPSRSSFHATNWERLQIANWPCHMRMLSTASAASTIQSTNSDNVEQEELKNPVTNSPSTIAAGPQRIRLAATRKETPLSIAQCLKLGESLSSDALLKNLMFLNRELPVRFSRRIMELNGLPSDLRETDPFQNLLKNYSLSFDELQTYSDSSRLLFLTQNTHHHHHHNDLDFNSDEAMQLAVQKEYANLLQSITNRHKQDVIYMAHGISLFRRYQSSRSKPSEEIQHFLNSFNRGRLGIRIMIGHHLALQHQFYHPDEPTSSAYLSTPSSAHSQRIGIIEPQCDIEALILRATQSAQYVFFQHYTNVFPPNVYIDHSKELGGKKVRFPVVPALLHHILFELLKNAMRATAEFHGLDKPSYPDIVVKLSLATKGDLSIVIKDHGGGIPSSHKDKLFNYMFTTASNTVCIDFPSIMTAVEKKPMNATLGENLPLCGFGFGLATSRLYARLFNGDLAIKSIAGSGTDATIRLKGLKDQIEQLK